MGVVSSSKRKQSRMFTLFYGEAGFEVFNAVHANDIKYINLLAHCVQTVDNVQPVETSSRGLMAASNTTDITNAFQKILPKVVDSITKSIEFGFSKSRFRKKRTSFQGLTIKSVFHLHTNFGNMEAFYSRVANLRAAEKAAKSMFIIYDKPDYDKMSEANERKYDSEADHNQEHHMSAEPAGKNTPFLFYLTVCFVWSRCKILRASSAE